MRLLSERCDYEVYMFVEVYAELLGAAYNVFSAYVRGERLLLHLLANALSFHALQALRTNESTGCDKAGELVHGVEGPGHEGLTRHVQVVGVAFYRLEHVFRIASARELSHADHRMFGSSGVLLIIHIVEETRDPPLLLVFAELPGVGPHRSLDGEHVFSQRVALRPLAELLPRFFLV